MEVLFLEPVSRIFSGVLKWSNDFTYPKMALRDKGRSRNRPLDTCLSRELHREIHTGRYTLTQSVNKAETINNRAVFRQDCAQFDSFTFGMES